MYLFALLSPVQSEFSAILLDMRYAFVFLSIFAMWVALILLALETNINGLFLALIVLIMTIVLFIIGFNRGR